MKKLLSIIMTLSLTCSLAAQVNINLDVNKTGVSVSPTLYGIFYEDINHAADGGIYAELIRNRSFEDDSKKPVNWSSPKTTMMNLNRKQLLNNAQKTSLVVTFPKDGGYIMNDGFWGIHAVNGRKYQLSFWARSKKKWQGLLTVGLCDSIRNDIGKAVIQANLSDKWTKLTAEFCATDNNEHAKFFLSTDKSGVLDFDVISLFPPTFQGRGNGVRPDLAHMLDNLKPSFMRFPGGCFVEGTGTPDNAFRWKRTIGGIEERPGHQNVNWGYRTSDGLGFHEYLQLAEDLHAVPLYVVNVGIWHGGSTPVDSIQPWIDECMAALEYANGDVTTKYGSMRAKNGHPAPFGIKFVEIGNENYNFHLESNDDQSNCYPDRYILFYKAIKQKYPDIQCIGNVEAWGTDSPSWRNPYPVDLLDEHYYKNPQWFVDHFYKYDSYSRKGPKIYVGEYAVTSQFGHVGNLNAALGEAVFMMGMENNSDVVSMASYAPIFVNENNAVWRPDMIRFNSAHVMGTPSYYVQQMFHQNLGSQTLQVTWTQNLPPQKSSQNMCPMHIGIGSWYTNASYRNPLLVVDGKEAPLPDLSQWMHQKDWSIAGGVATEAGNSEGNVMYCTLNISSKKYSYQVQAKKNSGKEGFLVVFGHQDDETYNWFNVGGWNNTSSAMQQTEQGNRMNFGQSVPNTIEKDKWYTIRVDVNGDDAIAFIDGKEFCRGKIRQNKMSGVYCSATQDEKQVYLKVVNTGTANSTAYVNFFNLKVKSAELIRLSSSDGNDENTLKDPTTIIPCSVPVTLGNIGAEFFLPAYSINVLKLSK
ncbi:MAG: alpha-L-arabinofuranosidase C-terminal domain-containing protein [Prevotella sp.]